VNKCVVLGVLDNGEAGLTAEHKQVLANADVVIGGSRVLALFQNALKAETQRFDLTGKLKEVPSQIEQALAANQAVVVLATGDPLCHGIATYLKKKIGLSKLDIQPNVSALQLACAKVGVSWQDAYLLGA